MIFSNDHTPREGITLQLTIDYAKRLAGLGIDGLEVSCGTTSYSPWFMCRGDIPIEDILKDYPESRRPKLQETLERMKAKVKLHEGYNLEATKMIRAVVRGIPLFAVGGWRHVTAMEEALRNGDTDLISLRRPFIREPSLVRKIREGKSDAASCISCNRCLMAFRNNIPVRCYYKGMPN